MNPKTLIYIISGCFLLAFIAIFIIRKHSINENEKTMLIVIQTICGLLSVVLTAINMILSSSTIIHPSIADNQITDEYSEQMLETPLQTPDTTSFPSSLSYDNYLHDKEVAMRGSYYSYEDASECVKEGHGYVKSVSTLNGFIYWNGKPDWTRSYYQNDSNDSTIADENEPLHHVKLIFDNDYYGMSLSVHTENHPEGGLAIEMEYDGKPVDCFVSEGTYLFVFGKWVGDSTYDIAKAYVTIDHCGTYYITMAEL